jgi:hypothetical protein
MAVSLRNFIDEMEHFGGQEWLAFLNRRTGELLSTSEEDRRAAEDEDDEAPEWQRERLPKIREAMSSDDWLTLPDKFELDEYRIMECFCGTVGDEVLRADLLDTIGGRGTFGRWKNMVHRHKLLDQWYQFRDQALREFAVGWLEANQIPYQD